MKFLLVVLVWLALAYAKHSVVTDLNTQYSDGGRVSVAFSAMDRNWKLDLEPSKIFHEGSPKIERADGTIKEMPNVYYTGSVRGHPKSVVSLTVTDKLYRGIIHIDNRQLWIESAAVHLGEGHTGLVLYDNERFDVLDFDILDGAKFVDDDIHVERPKLEFSSDKVQATQQNSWNPTYTTFPGIKLFADSEWIAKYGEEQGSQMVWSIMNDVNGLYAADGMKEFTFMGTLHLFDSASDPAPGDNHALNTLKALADKWGKTFAVYGGADFGYMFSGKDFINGGHSCVGLAYCGIACRLCETQDLASRYTIDKYSWTKNAVGEQEDYTECDAHGFGHACRVRVAAHEIGHNVGASHHEDGDSKSNIMNPVAYWTPIEDLYFVCDSKKEIFETCEYIINSSNQIEEVDTYECSDASSASL